MRLPAWRFIGRVLQHVLPVRTQVVRCYGLSHASQADAVGHVRAEWGQMPAVTGETPSWQAVCARQGDGHPERCPVCGQWFITTGTVARHGGPSPPEVDLGRVA